MCPMCALKMSRVPEYAHDYFSQNFSWAFIPIDPMNVHSKLEVRSCPIPEIIAWYLKTLGTPTLPFLQNFNELLFGWTHECTGHFSHPTSSLPKFPYVPLGVDGYTFGLQRAKVLG